MGASIYPSRDKPYEVSLKSKRTRKLVSVYHFTTEKEARTAAQTYRRDGAYSVTVSKRK